MDFKENFKIEQHKARCASFVASNQATIEFSKMALRAAFLLNAGCVIPIVYSKVLYFYPSAYMFALGALCAALASGASYISQCLITMMWNDDLFKTSFEDPYPASYKVGRVTVSRKAIDWFRFVPIVCVLLAYIFFALGLARAWDAPLPQDHPTEQVQQKTQSMQQPLQNKSSQQEQPNK